MRECVTRTTGKLQWNVRVCVCLCTCVGPDDFSSHRLNQFTQAHEGNCTNAYTNMCWGVEAPCPVIKLCTFLRCYAPFLFLSRPSHTHTQVEPVQALLHLPMYVCLHVHLRVCRCVWMWKPSTLHFGTPTTVLSILCKLSGTVEAMVFESSNGAGRWWKLDKFVFYI